ncbi:MAG: hypothetical protein A3C27_02460 [Candidatus Levybacteria bacterium RIFCSPHIGHO2_02_FULL_39_36]|nr:MAG: hypothetical protein UT20_C0013G0012 [Candidatus Levybacteria bacterium GW2011_GWA1_39_11]OGH15422.1 MAG: hypothetical protein A2689_02365 [Candidatus Levybacteria bacterium RIFCSPHIGHO2_01_FULL_38_96]OGH27454.1 MAG: hypothetical protein A3C27_02460 [Candidatus Levybacteria bacterium RIFCSPHIGHO2_02_FULL_39_36]OGH36290.1 MAG: hypothetical protein A3B43_02605 [Candidatus Levybacteria bacterium RIFCSPLOWO2_01_FULL_38_120]OGH47845.1 MAG: hypothetical protein A3G66_02160 [Candidatus Levybac
MISFFLFIFSLILFSLFSYGFIDPNLIYFRNIFTNFAFQQRELTTFIYGALVLSLFISFYFIFKKPKFDFKNIRNLIILTTIILLFSYPATLSYDIFNYITTAKVTFHYQENPYIVFPIEFVNDPYILFTRAANKTALYGPFWILLSAVPHFAGLSNFVLTLFSFKAFIALFYIGTVYLLQKIDRNAVLFFALNPLVIIETLVSAHNDIVMIFFALLAFYFIKTKKLFSIFALIGSILIKVGTIFLVPVYLLTLLNKVKGEKVYIYATISMFFVFLLSPLREELYPWYAIWFLAFVSLIPGREKMKELLIFFSLGLMLRYIPYMWSGNYFGATPLVRNLLMVIPPILYLFSLWLKRIYRS